MILHKLLIFLIILSRPVQSISNNGRRTALTATFSKFDLDIIPNPTVRFQISNIHWKALFVTNPTVLVSGESDGRISHNVNSKSMVEIRELPQRGAFYSGHYIIYIICIIYTSSISIQNVLYKSFLNSFSKRFQLHIQFQIKIEYSNINSF